MKKKFDHVLGHDLGREMQIKGKKGGAQQPPPAKGKGPPPKGAPPAK